MSSFLEARANIFERRARPSAEDPPKESKERGKKSISDELHLSLYFLFFTDSAWATADGVPSLTLKFSWMACHTVVSMAAARPFSNTGM